MESLRAFFSSFLPDVSQAGYRQPSDANSAPPDPDTHSASVNLEDIIDEYDEPSRVSRLTSSVTLNPSSNGGQPPLSLSQYFSLGSGGNSGGARDDETTSFYSALHDGFSLDEFELRNKYGGEFLWTKNSKNNSDERDNMLQRTDFQVTWHDLTYTIRPRSTLSGIWDEFTRKLTGNRPSSVSSLFGCLNKSNESGNNLEGKEGDSNELSRDYVKILQHVNGSFESGQLTAVMGPSGAGKTSLLNILSRRREEGFTGSINVCRTDHRVRINAIPQDDHLLECMTVRENLTFASRLKNPYPGQDHAKNVSGVSNLLGLNDCLDTRTKNISGGQQKRLAIAQELLSKPDILILDEPTSGLDSLTCLKTLAVLNDLVKASRKKMIDPIAIVLTIHQPQQEAFNLFDKVYVMANGGIVIYDGPPTRCTDFIKKYSGLKMPSSDYNPASFLVEIASGEYGQEPIDALAKQVQHDFKTRHGKFIEQASNNNKTNEKHLRHSISLNINESAREPESIEMPVVQMGRREIGSLDRISNLSLISEPAQIQKSRLHLDPRLVKSSSLHSGSFCLKTRILTERCWKSIWRDPKQAAARILLHIFLPFALALMLGTDPGGANVCPRYKSEYALKKIIVSDEYISPDRQEEFLLGLENTGVLFMSIYSCIAANIAAMTLSFSMDLKSCLKEYYNGWYSMNSYVFARIISDIPLDLLLPTVTVALTYVVTGQDTGNGSMSDIYRVIITSCGIVLASGAGQIMGMIFAAIYVGHITTALFASQGATLPFVLLSGFVARAKNMSKFVRALSLTSLFKHGLDITFIARYGWNVCECDPNKVRGDKATLTGVTDELKNFVKYWMNAQGEDTTTADPRQVSAGTSSNSTDGDDIFEMIAKQVQLYNTYGIEVKSCDQVKPYQLNDFGLTEGDLPTSFAALIILLIVMLLVLLLVIKFLVSYRTSL